MESLHLYRWTAPNGPERIEMLREHLRLFTRYWVTDKPFVTMRKFFPTYFRNFPGAKEALQRAYRTQTPEELERRLSEISF